MIRRTYHLLIVAGFLAVLLAQAPAQPPEQPPPAVEDRKSVV